MKSLREFAQFVGKPAAPISARALVAYLRLNASTPLSVRDLVQTFDGPLDEVALKDTSIAPIIGQVPFQITMRITKFAGYVVGVRWRILRDTGNKGLVTIAGYDAPLGPSGIRQVVHTVTEPGRYLVDAVLRAIGKDGFKQQVRFAGEVKADPKPAPPPPPPPPSPPASMKICAGETVPDGYIVVNDDWDPTSCGNPTTTQLNVWFLERYADKPIGASMNVCSGEPTPIGWVEIGAHHDPTACGDPKDSTTKNVKTIRRVK